MENAIKLLQAYQEFSVKEDPTDLARFGQWLQQKHEPVQDYSTNVEEVNRAGVLIQAAFYIGGLATFFDLWLRTSFTELQVASLNDFGIIKNVERLKNPTKKEVANGLVVELSTCLEAIKRLIKSGFLKETTDPVDRRKRRVSLTPKGQELSKTMDVKMMALSQLIMGNVSTEEAQNLLPTLKKLNDFHQHLYRQKTREEVKEVFGI